MDQVRRIAGAAAAIAVMVPAQQGLGMAWSPSDARGVHGAQLVQTDALDGCESFRPSGALATEDQLAQEELANRLVVSAPVRRAARQVANAYRADAQGATSAGKATIDRAVGAMSLAASQYAISEDPARPKLTWNANAPHCWYGLDVGRSGHGIDNGDNVYRHAAVDGASRYVIEGRIRDPKPSQLIFVLYGSLPGTEDEVSLEGGHVVDAITSDQMLIGPDGSFTLKINSDLVDLPNHLQSTADAKLLIVRDTLGNWGTEKVVPMAITRVSGPQARPPLDEAALADRAAELLVKMSRYWLEFDNRFVYSEPANRFREEPLRRPGAWGFANGGHFRIAEDEALVVTLDPLGATYLGFQVTDPWGVAHEYVERSGSLNSSQVKRNPDGSVTYVISAQDPGVWNWLDTGGTTSGIFAARWQGVPPTADDSQGVRDMRVVKLSDLQRHLPSGTETVDDGQRRDQLAARVASYQRRLTE